VAEGRFMSEKIAILFPPKAPEPKFLQHSFLGIELLLEFISGEREFTYIHH
jgi:hypothetical protein